MPIIFQFKEDASGPREPHETTLVPLGEGLERWASPLILRPYRRGAGRVLATAVRLRHPQPPGGVALMTERGGQPTYEPVDIHLSQAEAGKIRPLAGEPDPIERYLQEIRKL